MDTIQQIEVFSTDTPAEPMFRNYMLTNLCTVKIGKKKGLGDKFPVACAVKHILEPYGITQFGHVNVNDNLVLLGALINRKMPPENELLLQQMYGYENILVDVLVELHESYCISFRYNTSDHSCLLQQLSWGKAQKERHFGTMREMLAELAKDMEVEEILAGYETEK